MAKNKTVTPVPVKVIKLKRTQSISLARQLKNNSFSEELKKSTLLTTKEKREFLIGTYKLTKARANDIARRS